ELLTAARAHAHAAQRSRAAAFVARREEQLAPPGVRETHGSGASVRRVVEVRELAERGLSAVGFDEPPAARTGGHALEHGCAALPRERDAGAGGLARRFASAVESVDEHVHAETDERRAARRVDGAQRHALGALLAPQHETRVRAGVVDRE